MGEGLRIKLTKRAFYAVLISIAAVIFLAAAYYSTDKSRTYVVKDVIDGDTILLEDMPYTLRYIGVDAPETLRDDSPGDPFGAASTQFNRSLVEGRAVRVEFDKEKYDRFGRMLGYVFVDDKFVNELIVGSGLARVMRIKPNEKHFERLLNAETLAKRDKKGIWGNVAELKLLPANQKFLIKLEDAGNYIGQRVVVRGVIADGIKKEKVLVLNMEGGMEVVIFKGSWGDFSFFGIEPLTYYMNKNVEVIGRVSVYHSRPQIIVRHPIALRLLE